MRETRVAGGRLAGLPVGQVPALRPSYWAPVARCDPDVEEPSADSALFIEEIESCRLSAGLTLLDIGCGALCGFPLRGQRPSYRGPGSKVDLAGFALAALERDDVPGVGGVLEHHLVGLFTRAAVEGDDIAGGDVIYSIVSGDFRHTVEGSRRVVYTDLRRTWCDAKVPVVLKDRGMAAEDSHRKGFDAAARQRLHRQSVAGTSMDLWVLRSGRSGTRRMRPRTATLR